MEKCSFIIVIKDEIPRNKIKKHLQDLHEKIRILLENAKKTWGYNKACHVQGKEDLMLLG